MVQIRAQEIRVIAISEIKLNPNNRNKHTREQVERLAEIIHYQGFRNPPIISNRSGLCIAGEGRYLAAKKLGMKEIPVIFEDFDDEDQEYAAGISDNAINEWSHLDLKAINLDLERLDGAIFDLNMLGLKNFELCPEPKEEKDVCPKCKRAL